MSDSEKLQSFLQSATHMVLAVLLPDGTPWVVPVRIKNWQGKEFEWDSIGRAKNLNGIRK